MLILIYWVSPRNGLKVGEEVRAAFVGGTLDPEGSGCINKLLSFRRREIGDELSAVDGNS